MKAYILSHEVAYEPNAVIGIYSTEEKAEQVKSSLPPLGPDEWYDIQEFVVDEEPDGGNVA